MEDENEKTDEETEEQEEQKEEKEKEEKDKPKEEKKEEKKKEEKKEVREIPSEQVQEFRSRKPIIPILEKDESRTGRLEDSLAEIPTKKEKKEDRRYDTHTGYASTSEEERKYVEEKGREEERAKEITPRIERVTEFLPKRRPEMTIPIQREEPERREKIGNLEETREFVKYDDKATREPFEEELDWRKRERKIKKYKGH